MTVIQEIMRGSPFVAQVTKEMKQSNIGLFQATKLSAQLVAAGAVEIVQGGVVSGAKFVEAVMLKLLEVGGHSVLKGLSGGAFKRSGAELGKAFKTALLLTTAFVGPIKPQWVASVSEKLGLSPKEEHLLRRFWNTATEHKGKIGLGLLALGTASAVAYDVSQTGYIAANAKALWENFFECDDAGLEDVKDQCIRERVLDRSLIKELTGQSDSQQKELNRQNEKLNHCLVEKAGYKSLNDLLTAAAKGIVKGCSNDDPGVRELKKLLPEDAASVGEV